MRIGFIGLGTMGASMAANLQAAGHELVVHDINRAAAESHLSRGATWAATAREAAAPGLVFTSLPGPAQVDAVVLGNDGVLAGLPEGGACFDLSTNAPSSVRQLGAAFAERGAHFLDAPVSGGPAGAASRRLALWVGGDEEVFNRYHEVLVAIGDQPRWIGPVGAGSVAKLVHNCAGYILTVGLAEVFTLGVKAGVEPLALFEAIRQGALGRRRTFDGLADQFLPGTYDPPAFALKLAHKDVGLATALGREFGVPMRLANLTLEEMTEAIAAGWGGSDSRSCMRPQLARAGVDVTVDPARLKQAMAAG